jgi:catechol 2,3-dioxygenase-like lactoylglutathione lyase family enzyme
MSVDNLDESIKFYNAQFGAEATKVKEDYAQWLIDDMSLNFAISTRSEKKGIDHLGVQYESDEALEAGEQALKAAGIEGQEDKGAQCCYMESNKYWVKDPTGMVWENYHSTGEIELFGQESSSDGGACCTPTFQTFSLNKNEACTPDSGCCS